MYKDQEMGDPPRHFDAVSDVISIDRGKDWENLGLSFNEISQHFLSMFKVNNTSLSINDETEEWDSVDVRNLIPKWDYITIVDASDTYVEKLRNTLIPITNDVTLEKPWFVEEVLQAFPQNIGILNLEGLKACEKYHLKLDDALSMNSRDIVLHRLSTKETNRFVKCWIKGSNPRMRDMFVVLKEKEMNRAMLLKGLKYQVMPEELVRRIDEYNFIRGGFDIRNKQGKLATIYIKENTVNLIVWD